MDYYWKPSIQLTVKERKAMKEHFMECILNDDEREWEDVIINEEILNYKISNDGKLASMHMCKFMKPSTDPSGYLETVIRDNNGNKINVAIHRLVAVAFVRNDDIINNTDVNHIDGNKLNNHYNNLEWTTHKENVYHAINTGLRSNRIPNRKYTEDEILEVCCLLEKGKSIAKIHKITGASKRKIRNIKNGKSHTAISSQYNIPGLKLTQLSQSLKEQASTTIKSNLNQKFEEEFIYGWEM